MEAFNGFQFDVVLPDNITYVNNSIIESLRFNGTALVLSCKWKYPTVYSLFSSNKDFNGSRRVVPFQIKTGGVFEL
jgi:hypothetical protein